MSTVGKCIVFAILILTTSAPVLGQAEVERAAWSVRYDEPSGSPLRVRVTGQRRGGRDYTTTEYTLENTGGKVIWGAVIAGLPHLTHAKWQTTIGLAGGGRQYGSAVQDQAGPSDHEWTVTVDLVLFRDGTSWGPAATPEAGFLTGIMRGMKEAVQETRAALRAGGDNLRTFLKGPQKYPGLHAPMQMNVEEGLAAGYLRVLRELRASLDSRGDTEGIDAVVSGFDREISENAGDGLKYITQRHGIRDPLKIIEITQGSHKLGIDQSYDGGAEWLRGARITVRNDSGKTINYACLSLEFPETRATGNTLQSDLEYGGPSPGGRLRPVDQKPIGPGQVFAFVIDEKEYSSLKRFIGSHQPVESLSRLLLSIDTLIFADGTAWMTGAMMKQDPADPKKWCRPVTGNDGWLYEGV